MLSILQHKRMFGKTYINMTENSDCISVDITHIVVGRLFCSKHGRYVSRIVCQCLDMKTLLSTTGGGSSARRKLCFDFNNGNCQYGQRCKFEYKCSFCYKFGHGFFACRKVKKNNKNNNNHQSGNERTPGSDKDRWDHYEKNVVAANHQFNNNLSENKS